MPAPPDKALFRVLWHRGQVFECTTDAASARIEFPVVLPGVPSGSSMYAELRAYVASRQSSAVPEHRRIDPAAVRIRCRNRRSQAGLTAEVRNGDYEYAAKKLVHLVHEIYLDFLADGRYYDYMVETFDLDPDHM